MEWVTMRLTAPLRSSDVVGCGWVREGEEEGGKGNVYFTLNGQRTENSFTDAPPEMIPFLHIQKKVGPKVVRKFWSHMLLCRCGSLV